MERHEALEEQHSRLLGTHQAAHATEIAGARDEHAAALQALADAHTEQLSSLVSAHEADVDKHLRAQAKLEKVAEELSTAIKAARESYESELQRLQSEADQRQQTLQEQYAGLLCEHMAAVGNLDSEKKRKQVAEEKHAILLSTHEATVEEHGIAQVRVAYAHIGMCVHPSAALLTQTNP